MYKIYTKPGIPKGYTYKIWLIMRLTTVILIATIMQVSASSFAQKLSYVKSEITLKQLFKEITRQTGYEVLYANKNIDDTRKITVNFKDATLADVLKKCLEDQNVTYTIDAERGILIKAKELSFMDNISAVFTNIDVRGRVVDSTGEGLPGATVTVKARKQVTRTGADGSFILQNVEEGAILAITYTGYETKEIKASKDVGTIRMNVAIGSLTEVAVTVNTGYQRIKPEQSTGAVSQITTKEYESRINTSFLDGLVNKMPGLVINNDVLVNGRPLFNVRGISSMLANQNPLIVVDGYPTTLTLDMIDPNEVKSVTVLKDAAASTIYGVRASNGVIVIERKQASAGIPVINFRTTVGLRPKEDYSRYRWDKNASAIAVDYQRSTQSASVNSSTWGLMTSQAQGALNRPAPFMILAQAAAGMITPAEAESSFAQLASYDNLADYSRLFERDFISQNYNLNISGGNQNALYYITGNYTRNRNNQMRNGNNRLLLTLRSNVNITKRLSLELIADYSELGSKSGATPASPLAYAPYERFQNADGTPAYIVGSSITAPYNTYIKSQGLEDDALYPLVDMNEITNTGRTVSNKVNANLRYNIGNGFDVSVGGIYESSRGENKTIASERSSMVRQYVNDYAARQTDGTVKFFIPRGAYLRQTSPSSSGYTIRGQLNYNKKLGDYSINAIVGTEVRDLIDKSYFTTAFGYNDQTMLQQAVDFASIAVSAPAVRTGNFGLGNSLTNTSSLFGQSFNEDRFLSGYSNVVYSYKNRYSVSGSVRVDQSNLFGTDPKYKYKPLWSVGAAWNIHHENFMSGIKWVDLLKLRASYGFNGNVAKASLPQVIAQNAINTTSTLPSLTLSSYANGSLRWEQTENINLGLDFTIFRRINGNLDVYTKKSTDLLGQSLIDPTLGVSPTTLNTATVRNSGIDFGLRADWISRSNFNWNTGIAMSFNKSKTLEVYRRGNYDPATLNGLGYVKGYPIGVIFSYNTVGLDNEGYPMIQDPDGNIVRTNINTTANPAMSSETSGLVRYSGSTQPTINMGLSNRIDIGNFYFYAMVNYTGGFKVRIPRPDPRATRAMEGAGNYWKKAGDELNTNVMTLAGFLGVNATNAYNNAASDVVHGDYLTVGDLAASYRFDKVSFLKKAGFKSVEIKAQASNIYTVGFNRYNYSQAIRSYAKTYLTPTYTFALFTNF